MKLCTNCNKEIPIDHTFNSCSNCLQEGFQKNKHRYLEEKRFHYLSQYRKKENNLSSEDILTLSFANCYYCGKPAKDIQNGIDRVDNSKGYLTDNVVPCCKMCNKMKLTHSREKFIQMVEHIVVYNGMYEGELYPDAFQSHYGWIKIEGMFNLYQKEAFNRQKEFVLTFHEFADIQKHPCYLCGKENNNAHKNGIDRVDNLQGYLLNNVRACCGDCNKMKHVSSLHEFFDKCLQITTHVHSSEYGKFTRSDENVAQVTKRLKREQDNKSMHYRCWANKVFQLNCQTRIRHQKHYCHHHEYFEKYTDLEITQLRKCNVCYEFGVLPVIGCRECNRKLCDVEGCELICDHGVTQCVVHRNEGSLCQALTDGRGKCLVTCHKSNSLYCYNHLAWLSYTPNEISHMSYCRECMTVHLPDQCKK